MFDSKDLRAAALSFGLPFLLVPPVADGAIAIDDAAHALASYRYDLADVEIEDPEPVRMAGRYSPTLALGGTYQPSLTHAGRYSPTVTMAGSLDD